MRGANTPMRRMLSGFLATSMIVAVASSVSFAAQSTVLEFKANDVTINPSLKLSGTADAGKGTGGNVKYTVDFRRILIDVETNNGDGTIEIPVSVKREASVAYAPAAGNAWAGGGAALLATDVDVVNMVAGRKFSSVRIGEKLYSGAIEKVPNHPDIFRVVFSDETMGTVTATSYELDTEVLEFDPDNAIDPQDAAGSSLTIVSYTNANIVGATKGGSVIRQADGNNLSDVERTGVFETENVGLEDVIVCDGDGRPVPMTEDPEGVDKDLNGQNGIQSGSTLYFMINDSVQATFADDTFWKLKVTKGDNSKMIKAITDTTKTFGKSLYNAYYGNRITGIDFTKRHRFIKVELNEIYTDDEYKISLDARLSPKTKAVEKFDISDDSEIKVKDFYFYMKNIVKAADNDWRVGVGGLMLNPLENDWNEVTYFDEDGDVAFMKFFADSDVGKFYAKLSTRWEHTDYASYFNDQDAYIFQFTGSPSLSSTSRADLQIYNPFLDDDGNSKIDPETATIYQIVDGDLFDVTENFSYEEGNNGDMAYCTRTRFLGTYIICEKPVEEASSDDVVDLVPDDLVPDNNTGAPVEVTPGNNGGSGSKAPANTGKF